MPTISHSRAEPPASRRRRLRTPIRRGPPPRELAFTWTHDDSGVRLWLSHGSPSHIAQAWVAAGPGGVLIAGRQEHIAAICSPLEVAMAPVRFVRSAEGPGRLEWHQLDHGAAVLTTDSPEIAETALREAIDDLLIGVGAPALDPATSRDLALGDQGGNLRHARVERGRRTYRLIVDTESADDLLHSCEWLTNGRTRWRRDLALA